MVKPQQRDYKDTLKELLRAKSRDQLLELARSTSFVECAKLAVRSNPSDYSSLERDEIGVAVYQAGKRSQFGGKTSDALVYFRKANEYLLDSRLKTIVQNRISMIQKRGSNDSKKPMIQELKANLSALYPNEKPIEALKKQKPELFVGAKAPLRIPRIHSLTAIGVYRWRGDPSASDFFSQFIRDFKMGEQVSIDFMCFLAREYLGECAGVLQETDFVIPVPAEPGRENERGYDLATELGKAISAALGIPMQRPLERKSQGGRSRDCSFADLKRQYTANPAFEHKVRGMSILLVDDVVTKGHTVEICADLLYGLGVKEVNAFCLARAESTLKSSYYS